MKLHVLKLKDRISYTLVSL